MIKIHKPSIYGYEYEIKLQGFEPFEDGSDVEDASAFVKGEKKSVIKKRINLILREKWLSRNGIISYKIIDDAKNSKTIHIEDGKIQGYPSTKIRMYGYLGFPRTSEGAQDSENLVVSDSVLCALYDNEGIALGYWLDTTDYASGGYNHKYFYSDKDEYDVKVSQKDLTLLPTPSRACTLVIGTKLSSENVENGSIYQSVQRCSHSWGMDFIYLDNSQNSGDISEDILSKVSELGYEHFIIFFDAESYRITKSLLIELRSCTIVVVNPGVEYEDTSLFDLDEEIHILMIDSKKSSITASRFYNSPNVHLNFIDEAYKGFGFANKLPSNQLSNAGRTLGKCLTKVYDYVTKTDEEIYQINVGKTNIPI